MLDIGWSELLVVAVVAIVVVGPKDLPKLMRSFGFYAGKLRRTAADFQRQFDEAMAESEADEVRKNLESIRSGLGGTVDLDAPTNTPVMMPTPAPAAIEEAILPPPEPKAKAKPAAKAKSAAKAKPAAQAKTSPQAKTGAKATKTGPKATKTPAKTTTKAPTKTAAKPAVESKTATKAKTAAKRSAKAGSKR
jgi:sec-independent protein translocase protein TatB